MNSPPTLELIAIAGLGRDYSLREERAAEALEWLELVTADVDCLPGGSRFASLLSTLRDEQRRADLRRMVSPQARQKAEALLDALLREDWDAQHGPRPGTPPAQAAA